MLHQCAIQTPLLNLAKQSDVVEDSALLVPRNPKPNLIYSRPSIVNLFWRTTLPPSAMAATAKTVKDVPSHEFVRAYAAHLKKSGKINVPTWVDIVKTATFKELAPYDPDWYYIRTASMARKIYLRHGIGLGAFRKIYGGRKSNGVRPSHFAKSSGAIARSVLKQLETLDIINKDPKGGRRITSSGQRDLDQVAGRIAVAPA